MDSPAEKREKEAILHKRILVVENDTPNAEVLKMALSQGTPYQVCIASSDADALHMIEAETPDLILMDYRLPGINGLELYERMREMPRCGRVPIVFVTANSHKEQFMQAGIPLIEKPYDLDALFERLHQFLDPTHTN